MSSSCHACGGKSAHAVQRENPGYARVNLVFDCIRHDALPLLVEALNPLLHDLLVVYGLVHILAALLVVAGAASPVRARRIVGNGPATALITDLFCIECFNFVRSGENAVAWLTIVMVTRHRLDRAFLQLLGVIGRELCVLLHRSCCQKQVVSRSDHLAEARHVVLRRRLAAGAAGGHLSFLRQGQE